MSLETRDWHQTTIMDIEAKVASQFDALERKPLYR